MTRTQILAPLSIAALLALGAGCTWVSTPTRDEAINCLDKDGDGFTYLECPRTPDALIDCNDNPDLDGALERPGLLTAAECPEPVDPEAPLTEDNCPNLWYDGLDNDCSFSDADLVHDVLDHDGDGFPGIAFEDWASRGKSKEWPATLPKTLADVDCDDQNPAANPRAIEAPYDGLDANCDGKDDFDNDGDGYIDVNHEDEYQAFADKPWFKNLPGGDCDDNKAAYYPGAAGDVDYDGFDNNCDGANEFDLDGDGYIEEQYQFECPQYNSRYGYEVSCVVGDCNDLDASINEGVDEIYYDGVDSNCDGKDDFDNDGDGYVSPDVYSAYQGYSGLPWYGGLPSGDCEGDANPDVHPGVLEVLGDTHDQDCDGDIDTTTFAFGPMHTAPSKPVVGSLTDVYVVALFDEFSQSGTGTPSPSSGTGVSIPALGGFEEPLLHYLKWLPPSSAQVFGEGLDMWAGGDAYVVAYSYVSASRAYLDLRERWLDPTQGSSGVFRNGPRVSEWMSKSTPQRDLDLLRDSRGDFWVGSCGEGWAWFMFEPHNPSTVVDPSTNRISLLTEPGSQASAQVSVPDGGGTTCWLEEDAGNIMTLHAFNAISGVNSSYVIDDGGGAATMQPTTSPKYSFTQLNSVNEHHGLRAFAAGTDGLILSDGANTWNALTAATTKSGTNWNVLDADAIDVGSKRYIAAIVADPAGGDPLVVLAFGNPGQKLDDNVFDFAVPTVDANGDPNPLAQPQAPYGVALMADTQRLILAVTGRESSPDVASDSTHTYDAMGWAVLGMQ